MHDCDPTVRHEFGNAQDIAILYEFRHNAYAVILVFVNEKLVKFALERNCLDEMRSMKVANKDRSLRVDGRILLCEVVVPCVEVISSSEVVYDHFLFLQVSHSFRE